MKDFAALCLFVCSLVGKKLVTGS